MELLQAPWKADGRAFVAEVSLDLARDGQRREGGELIAEVGVEALDRLDQPEVADLDDVVERLSAVLKLAREEVHEIAVRVHQPGADAVALSRILAVAVTPVERPQLLAGQPPSVAHSAISVCAPTSRSSETPTKSEVAPRFRGDPY